MRTSTAISLLCATSALAASAKLTKRQSSTVETCAETYGPGYVKCGTLYCYNPGRGEPCCADGSGSCDAGEYCAVGPQNYPLCCIVGESLQDCGAIKSIGTLPPPSSSAAAYNSTATPYSTGAYSTTPVGSVTSGYVSSTSYSVVAATGGANGRLGAEAVGMAIAGLGIGIPFL